MATWVRKIRYLLKQPPFIMLMLILDKIPGKPIQLGRFFILTFTGTPTMKLRGFGTVRAGTIEDIPSICLLENKSPELFLKRFHDTDNCVVAIDDKGKVVGHAWFSSNTVRVDHLGYKQEVPRNTLFAYSGFITPEYRLRGVWILFQKYLLDYVQMLGREKIITIIEYHNVMSLKSHLRFGYKITTDVICFKLITKWLYFRRRVISSHTW